MATKKAKIDSLHSDKRNANKGTSRGNAMLDESLSRYGAGRSILIDKHGNIIAGNKTAEKWGELGMEDIIVVPTDGKTLVAVQRTDIDINSKQGRELAIADNRTGEVNLDWDADILAELAEETDLSVFFTEDELDRFLDRQDDRDDESTTTEIDPDNFEFDCTCPKCGFQYNSE